MKHIAIVLLGLLSLNAFSQKVETVVRANGLEDDLFLIGGELAVRTVFTESFLTNFGTEVAGNFWRNENDLNSFYLTVTPFLNLRTEFKGLEGFVNLGPSIAFAYGDDLDDQQKSLDLGIHHSIGIVWRSFIFEYYHRIGFREYNLNQAVVDFDQLGLGLGYRF